MTTLTLYYTPGTCAQAVRIALEEAGAAHQLVRVDFAAGQQRTPEARLHLYELLGGWPGALVAQQKLRHKSSKQAFREVFWSTVVLNVLGFVLLASPGLQRLILG